MHAPIKRLLAFGGLLYIALLPGPAVAQPFFKSVTDQAFSRSYFAAVGLAFGDYNNDGWPDMFVAEGRTRTGQRGSIRGVALLANQGDGRFVDRRDLLPADLTRPPKGAGAVFGDYDNDGDLDLYVPTGSWWNVGRDRLLRNDRGVFRDVGPEAGLTDSLPTQNAIWLDYDRDGYLDLYTGHWLDWAYPDLGLDQGALRNALYRNRGDGTFAETTRAAGLDIDLYAGTERAPLGGGSATGMVAGDFDDDGWPDLYLGVFLAPNRLFLNDGAGGFRDATTGDIGDVGQAYGAAVGDINNDGALDIFQAAGGGAVKFRSLLLLNLGGGQFADFTEGVGLAALGNLNLIGTRFADIDNDGDLDLLTGEPHFLFLNDGDGFFEDATAQSGLTGSQLDLTFVDYDRDGFLDGAFLRDRGEDETWGGLYRNRGNDNHHLKVELAGVASNRQGIGARLWATAGSLRQVREIFGGNGLTMDEPIAHFGLGERTRVDSLVVRWPSGQVDVLTDIAADQQIRVFEGRGTYQAVRPTTWEKIEVSTSGSMVDVALAVRPVLFEAGAEVVQVTADLRELGGPDALELTAADGLYQLQHSLASADVSGVRTIALQIEQATSLGPYWTELSRSIVVEPALDRVLFSEAVDGVWTLRAQTLFNLSRHSSWDGLSHWSLDGAQVFFSSFRDGNMELYAVDLDGTNLRRLTHSPNWDSEAEFSPDGTRIAFLTRRDEGNWEIYTMDADGGNPTNLTNHPAKDAWPTWSPDGSQIVFNSERDEQIFIGDGVGNWEIFAMDADGSNQTNLTNNPANDSFPAWSPDGSTIAFMSDRGGLSDIYTMDAEGGNLVNLTNRPSGDDRMPSWSPDGRRLVFASNRSGNSGVGGPEAGWPVDHHRWEIYMMDADGGNQVPLTYHPAANDWWPWWSPDGRHIAFTSNRGSNSEVYVLSLDPGERIRLDPDQSSTVYRGGTALEVQTQAGQGLWQVVLSGEETLELTGYEGLHLAFHPGDVDLAAGAAVQVVIGEGRFDLAQQGLDLAQRDWQVVEVPLDRSRVGRFAEAIVFSGNLQGTFYLDDVRLVTSAAASGTAVLEAHDETVPQEFGLGQNYPNPFNSGTIIRFALPAADEVDLALYNLAGQQVMRLAQGRRAAGSYTVRWDGRDEAGRELASGLYLYRLRAGDRVETRKLLLLR